MGVLYGDNAASAVNSAPYIPMVKPFTVTFWVYIFRIDQDAYLISRYVNGDAYIGLKIKEGSLVAVSKGPPPATTATTSSTMYQAGWNTISLTHDGTSFTMRGMNRFGSLLEETKTEASVGSSNGIMIGGSLFGPGAVNSLKGIINRMWYYEGSITNPDFQTLYSFNSGCQMI